MASADQDYMAFLDKANADPSARYNNNNININNNENVANVGSATVLKTMDEGVRIPSPIAEVIGRDLFYMSDADEPFVPVALKWVDEGAKGLPDESKFIHFIYSFCGKLCFSVLKLSTARNLTWMFPFSEADFAHLIQHWDPGEADIQILDPIDWDRHGRYIGLLDAVRRVVEGGDVRVYRVARDGTRAEYWLVGCQGSGQDGRIVGAKALAVES